MIQGPSAHARRSTIGPANVDQALEQIFGDDPNHAWEWLHRFFRGAALKVMCYTTKTGVKRFLPPVSTTADAEDIAAEMCSRIAANRKLPTIPVGEGRSRFVMGMWTKVRLAGYIRECRQRDMVGEYLLRCLAARRSEDDWRELRRRFEAIRVAAAGPLRQGLDAVHRHVTLGTSYAKLAKEWGISEGTLRNQAFRALQYLRREMLGDA